MSWKKAIQKKEQGWNRRLTLIFAFFPFFPFFTFSQQIDSRSFMTLVESLNQKSLTLTSEIADSSKRANNEDLEESLQTLLQLNEADFGSVDSLKSISILIPESGTFRLATWMMTTEDGEYEYFGMVSVHRADDQWKLYSLNDASMIEDNYQELILATSEWYGALYYELIPCGQGDSVNYTLLGWKGNNPISTKKVIDVLKFNVDGEPEFGAPVFNLNTDSICTRMIYEFSAEVSMTISYSPEKNVIILDHLYPSHPSLKGHYEYYGPDLSFDAFHCVAGKWKYIDDYDPGLRPETKEYDLKKGVKVYDAD